MPWAPKKPCAAPGCGALTDGRWCATHTATARVSKGAADKARGSAASRGYGHKWRTYRQSYLSAHPLCVTCSAEGIVTPATVVDHIQPHRGDHLLFWGPDNHQPLCQPCHRRKTASEDGAFGNPRRAAKGVGG